MSGGREATSEQSSSIREGANYDKVYPSGREPEENLSWSPARKSSTHSPAVEEEGCNGEEGDVEGEEGDDENEGYEGVNNMMKGQ